MRTYEQTHSWIKFALDLNRVNYKIWLLLGEAQSKCAHLTGIPLLPSVAQEFYQVYLAKGVLATIAIEGNTLTEQQVLKRIEGKLKLPPSKEYLGQEIDNIVEACNRIAKKTLDATELELEVQDLKEYNRLVLANLSLDEGVVPGEIRKHSVVVGTYKGAPPEDCEYLMQRLCDWLNRFEMPKDDKVAFGFLKAIVAHVYMAWIHPFGDGNGRTARLIEFQILLSLGVPATAAHLLSNHYNETRTEYYRQLDMASKSGGDILPFIQYALRGFVDGLREQIALIQEQQLVVHWVNYIHDMFRDKNSIANIRQRHLILDLSNQSEPTPLQKIRHTSPRLAEAYAHKTDKTIQRDLNVLMQMGLVTKAWNGYRAKREIILGFLPPSRK